MSYHPDVGEWVSAKWVLGRKLPARVVDTIEKDGQTRYLCEFVRDGETVDTRYYRTHPDIAAYDPLPEPIEAGSQWREVSTPMDDDVFEIKSVTVMEDGENVNITLCLPHNDGATTSVDHETFIERVVKGEIVHHKTAHEVAR